MSAVARSRYWRSTAIFVTYDEGGGFWDHVGPPRPPVAPADTIGFHGRSDLLEVKAPRARHWLTIILEAETGGLTLDRALSGQVNLTLTKPAGVTAPARFPASAVLAGGRASLRVKFPAPGYYRIAAAGPDGSLGWTTVIVL